MRSGTGLKRRVIRALNVSTFEPFWFDRSINPRGGRLAKMKVRTTKTGRIRVKIFQDTNSDGRVSRKELIFHGKAGQTYKKDELTNFSGSVRLKKTMHRCNWLSMKFPEEPLMCTLEYIPTFYDLLLTEESGKIYEFEGVGQFLDPILK